MSFATMLRGLREAGVRFVVVGGLAATVHGSRRLTDDLDICYEISHSNLEKLSSLLEKWNAYPRGIEPGLPFFMDERQFRTTPLMALTTTEGFIDVLDAVKGVGAYDKCHARSTNVESSGVRFRVLDLDALIDAKYATGRKKDLDQLPELEALLAMQSTGG